MTIKGHEKPKIKIERIKVFTALIYVENSSLMKINVFGFLSINDDMDDMDSIYI